MSSKTNNSFKASAPGNLMLMGEHAVLFGYRALACAVDCRMSVELTPRKDNLIRIDSDLAKVEFELENIPNKKELRFVLGAIKFYEKLLPSGFDLLIKAGFSATVGLGSSAAVTASTVAVLRKFCGESTEKQQIFDDAFKIVRTVQGTGSGTDLAASVFGGIIGYTMPGKDSDQIRPFSAPYPEISLYYTGYKKPTPEVIQLVKEKANQQPELYEKLYQLMHETTQKAEEEVSRKSWKSLGKLMNFYQGLMEALGVADSNIRKIISRLSEKGSIGAKISGSGLGDCVISLGKNFEIGYERIPVKIAEKGVTFE